MTTETPSSPAPDRAARWVPRADSRDERAPLVDRVLHARGITGDAALQFLHPSLNDLHDPSSIPDLDRAAARILDAAREREQVAIYGDYDVDGCTGAAILVRMLRLLGAPEPLTYVPHRTREGYGVHSAALKVLHERGATLIVTVDCGITALEPARVARALGLDLIITDHHHPPERVEDLPNAYAVVHPGRPDSSYPFPHLCGAGVAYKLAWRMATLDAGGGRVGAEARKLLLDLLALAAMGTVADVVPLVGENRVLTRFGLGRVPESPFVGLPALAAASGMEPTERVSAEDIGFKLGPRLNAAGRLAEGAEALELLITDDPARAQQIARTLCVHNDQRRALERRIFEEATELVMAAGMDTDEHRAIVLSGEGWHPGVLGIVCSRLVERFHRPAVLLTKGDDGLLTGSGRGCGGFDLHAALTACSSHLTRFGGHRAAAGMALAPDALEGFRSAMLAHTAGQLEADDLRACQTFDCDAAIGELRTDTARELESLGPFGAAHPPVRVRLRGLSADGPPKLLGAKGDHAAVLARDGERRLRLMGWRMAPRLARLAHGARFDAIVEPKLNRFNGRTSVEPTLVDFRQV